jgi:3-phosphoshikimate 1-carboxyvinyltransferase
MKVIVEAKIVSGKITMPASKSISQRACAAALLHHGQTTIHNFGNSEDELAALNIIQSLGAQVIIEPHKVQVFSSGKPKGDSQINCGESGLSARLFTPIAALHTQPILINGKGSLLQRPMHFFKESLEPLGVAFDDFSGRIPFKICGPLIPQNMVVDGSMSSQFISGLLFAFSAIAKEKVCIEVKGLVSKPYIDLTLEMLALFGKRIQNKHYRYFEIDPAFFSSKDAIEIQVEGDWSSAAFWIAAATIKGAVVLSGLNSNSLQADKKILDIAQAAGASLAWQNDELHIHHKELKAFEADLTDCPDLFPVLAVLAACCKGQSKLVGLHRLMHKESDRAKSIAALLSLLGVVFIIEGDQLNIKGTEKLNALKYTCPKDHRMAMAAALASLHSEGKIEIENAECVHKSYPEFWSELIKHQGQT